MGGSPSADFALIADKARLAIAMRKHPIAVNSYLDICADVKLRPKKTMIDAVICNPMQTNRDA